MNKTTYVYKDKNDNGIIGAISTKIDCVTLDNIEDVLRHNNSEYSLDDMFDIIEIIDEDAERTETHIVNW